MQILTISVCFVYSMFDMQMKKNDSCGAKFLELILVSAIKLCLNRSQLGEDSLLDPYTRHLEARVEVVSSHALDVCLCHVVITDSNHLQCFTFL